MKELENKKMPITNYLNQRFVFDLLASIEDGFSQITTLSTSNQEGTNKTNSVSGELGISNAFAFIGAKLRGEHLKTDNKDSNSSTDQEKVHTPTSLFSKLLDHLYENKLVTEVHNKQDIEELEAGDFVLFNGFLKQNPMVSFLDLIEELMDMYPVMAELQDEQQNREEDEITEDQYGKIQKQIRFFKDILTQSETADLICEINGDEQLRAVLPIYMSYFFNNDNSQIVDGNFKVVGKVIKIVNDEDDEKINLFRNTTFRLFNSESLEEIFDGFNNFGDEINISKIETEIKEPSFLVLPIAIYA